MSLADRFHKMRIEKGDSQEALAGIAGVTKQAISKIESGQTLEPASSTLDPIAAHWGVMTQWLSSGMGRKERVQPDVEWDNVLAYAQAAGLGSGAEANEWAETHKLKFRHDSLRRKGLHNRKLAVFYGKGDSMEPRIKSGDAILFDEQDTKPVDDTIYIIMWRDNYFAKRAMVLDGSVYFESDNPAGDHQWKRPKRKDDPKDPITVIGRVRWIGSWEG